VAGWLGARVWGMQWGGRGALRLLGSGTARVASSLCLLQRSKWPGGWRPSTHRGCGRPSHCQGGNQRAHRGGVSWRQLAHKWYAAAQHPHAAAGRGRQAGGQGEAKRQGVRLGECYANGTASKVEGRELGQHRQLGTSFCGLSFQSTCSCTVAQADAQHSRPASVLPPY